jgi:ubiquinone/menaquinone biosynthesis C-methylase UbiE
MENNSQSRKQVDKAHYAFDTYMSKERWNSVWHQLDEILKLEPASVLEIGPGPGTFKSIAHSMGLNVKTLDLDPELKPDILGSATSMPLPDADFDIVCAFQMLEHLPYVEALKAFSEMARVASRYIVISLPDSRPVWRYRIFVPKIGVFDRLLPRPFWRPVQHQFDGQHYWEVNKAGHSLEKLLRDFSLSGKLIKTYRVAENPYHRFFVFNVSAKPPAVISEAPNV